MAERKLQGIVSHRGIRFKYDDFAKYAGSNMKPLLKQLTLSRVKKMGTRIIQREESLYKVFMSNGTKLILFARHTLSDLKEFLPPGGWGLTVQLPPGEPIDPDILQPGPTLDQNQTIALEYMMENVYSPDSTKATKAGCTLVMGMGTGKTFMAVGLIGELGVKTVIIAPSDAVLDESRKALMASYPNLVLGEYTGTTKRDGDVVLMIINSALSDEFTFTTKITVPGERKKQISTVTYKAHEYFAKFGLVVFDEVHTYTSSGRQEIFWRTGCKWQLGLTGTPDENAWEMDIIYQKHVGPLVRDINIPGYNLKQIPWKGSIYPIMYYGPPDKTRKLIQPSTGWESYGMMVEQFAADPYRNKFIIDRLVSLWNQGRNVFVFTWTRMFANFLAGQFNERLKLVKTETKDAVVLMGGASIDSIRAAPDACMIFTTYDFGSTGISIPKMDTLCFVIPRMARMRQTIGRILRKSGDISIFRHIYDLVDAETDLGIREYKFRKKIYKEKEKYEFIIEAPEEVKYTDIVL